MTYKDARDRIVVFLKDNYDVIDYKDRIALLMAITALEYEMIREVR